MGSQTGTMPPAMDGDLLSLAQTLLDTVKGHVDGDKGSKADITALAKKIVSATTGPEELIGGYATSMGEIAACNQFMEWKLFDKIPEGTSISYEELARTIDAEPKLIARIGGMLVSTGRLVQTSSGHVAHSKTSRMFKRNSPPGNLFRVLFDHGMRGFTHWQDYFAKYGNKEPAGVSHNPFTFGWGHADKTVWEVVDLDEEKAQIFASAMQSAGSIAGRFGGPASIYDFGWLGEEASNLGERPLIVDVGGSFGETLKHILDSVPAIPASRCVLQDRQEVMEQLERSGKLVDVQKIGHDFMQPNPTRGAMIYLLRRVLHDWSDDSCIKILANLADALPSDEPRARVLIMEQVVADPPSPRSTGADMIMLNIGGKERSADGFKSIVEAAGMKIVGIHRRPGSEVGVVECAKA